MDDRVLFTINRRGVFSLEEARQTLPVVRRITQEFSAKVESLIARLEAIKLDQTGTICELETQVNGLIQTWNDKIRKLGAHPKGLWVVDFDHGDGFYCWKYPEPDVMYWHGHADGFPGRKPILEDW